ncbi:DNA-formamidopyrimidine glycosylase [Cohnella faecalis]|uniref:Formamidopyrimidine-DNA glycosylase n=1 Tax=Cohnella faecalis TaxID=2315694 RepID=A0A398CYA4_9BACL|nr:DNA-formamidopyrimidine glycosylase [Cohnella faecalis]RIE04777.1 DNA-formamidopyrimidine glycosylase [Cohnella faecalis]
MPEWPEMETYRTLLSPLVCGRTIQNVEISREKTINMPENEFRDSILGKKILFVERRGKQLLFHLDDGYRLMLHLMLGGYVNYGEQGAKTDDHYQVIIGLDDGNRLFFGGLRLGYLHRVSAKAVIEQLRDLGPDPFDPRLTLEAFRKKLGTRRGKLKPVLTDQKFLSGIGNCYSDEIAFDARIHPETTIASLDENASARLYQSMRSVLEEAASAGGYMEIPLTADDELTGGYNDQCKVYDRGGEPCVRCGTPIVLETLSSRKMFYCPECQRKA